MSEQNSELNAALENPVTQDDVLKATAAEGVISTKSIFTQYIWPVLLPLLVSLMAIGAYHFWFANQKTGVAVVDMSEIVAIQKAQFVKSLSGANVTDKDREKSFLMVSSFAGRMKAAISEIQKDCHCTLVVKNAIIGEVADYTESLKAKMGMTGMSVGNVVGNEASTNASVEAAGGATAFFAPKEDFLEGLQGIGK